MICRVMVKIQYTTCSFRSSHEPPLELMAFDPGEMGRSMMGKHGKHRNQKRADTYQLDTCRTSSCWFWYCQIQFGMVNSNMQFPYHMLFCLACKQNTKHCCVRHRLGSSGRAITARFADRTRLSLDERAQTINSEKRPTKDDCTETFPLLPCGQAFLKFGGSDLVLEGVLNSFL